MGITAALLFLCIVPLVLSILKHRKSKDGNQAPGPYRWPILGNLIYIGSHKDVIDAFSNLRREYGDIATIQLGVFNAVVISGWKHFKDVLVTRGQIFEARPAFSRYSLLFGNDRNNSLAFCDGSEKHEKNRANISAHSFMRNGTAMFEGLENSTSEEVLSLVDEIKSLNESKVDIKPELSKSLGKIFVKYFTSVESDKNDQLFNNMVKGYNDIFDEVNEGCIGDVLPVLMHAIDKSSVIQASHKIREYLEKRCVEPRLAARNLAKSLSTPDENNNSKAADSLPQDIPNDLLNTMLDACEASEDLTLDQALFAMEDILGGSAAVSNMIIRILYYIAKNPNVQTKIREEVAQNGSIYPNMSDRLPYTEATIYEALRFSSSGIVPHVATVDTTIDDYTVKKGTIVMFNNYDLNFSPELWDKPEEFTPERFITEAGHIRKPEFYIPFSTGRRSCLGYKMFLNISSVVVANLCQSFEIELDPLVDYTFPRGCPAVGKKSFDFIYNRID